MFISVKFTNAFYKIQSVIYLFIFVVPDGSHTRRKTGSFTGNASEEEIKVEVHNALIKKQDTEEEDIDELVRTFKESEAATPKDTGDAGETLIILLHIGLGTGGY